jgi:hypothetical protein
MVRPFEKPHARLPRRPPVPSPSRNHHERPFPYILSLVEGPVLWRIRGKYFIVLENLKSTRTAPQIIGFVGLPQAVD